MKTQKQNKRVINAKRAMRTYGMKGRKGYNVIQKRLKMMHEKYPEVF